MQIPSCNLTTLELSSEKLGVSSLKRVESLQMKDLASALDELPYRESRKKARKEDPKLILIAIHEKGLWDDRVTVASTPLLCLVGC